MKTQTKTSFLLVSSAMAGLMLTSLSLFAQQKTSADADSTKTITVHITKEMNGKKLVIDTTFVAGKDFDVDTFFHEKGIEDDAPGVVMKREKHMILRHPGGDDFTWDGEDGDMPDTIKFNGDRVIVFSDDQSDRHHSASHHEPGMQYRRDFNEREFPPMPDPRFEERMDGMMRSLGLENMAPFGDMKQVIVKKKRNGKKVIITFEDRDEKEFQHEQGRKKNGKVMILKDEDEGMVPDNEEQIIINGEPGTRTIITKHVQTSGNRKTITVNADADKPASENGEKKVIVIEEKEVK